MSGFEIPDWAMPTPEAPPPPDPMVAREQQIADTTRAEQGLNQFLAAKQSALFEAPDAFYRQQGEDAIHAAPVATQKLDELRRDLLDRLGNDTQRQRLGDALDAQMHLAREGMARHVAEQSLAWQRGVAQDRIALLAKEAAHHHNDGELIDALGHAAASAARAHSRVGDGPPGGQAEDTAAATARSGVLGAAIQAKIDVGRIADAATQLERLEARMDPIHAEQLRAGIDAAENRVALAPNQGPLQPRVRWQDYIKTPRFEPNVIVPWKLQRPEIQFDFGPVPFEPPPEDDRPGSPMGLPGEDIG
jgi:hypothetical protein